MPKASDAVPETAKGAETLLPGAGRRMAALGKVVL